MSPAASPSPSGKKTKNETHKQEEEQCFKKQEWNCKQQEPTQDSGEDYF
jgi:hypothetical protein